MNPAIAKACRRAKAERKPYIVLSSGLVCRDTPANRGRHMHAAIIYIARPSGRHWHKPQG